MSKTDAVANPLERLSPDDLRAGWDFYLERCWGLRLQIGESINNFELAGGHAALENPLSWSAPPGTSLGDTLTDADIFLSLPSPSVITLDGLEEMIGLYTRLAFTVHALELAVAEEREAAQSEPN